MSNEELLELIKVLARHIKLLEENIEKIYDAFSTYQKVNILPPYASSQNRKDEATINRLIKYYD